MTSHQHDSQYVIWTRTKPTDMPNRMVKSPQCLNPRKETIVNQGKMGVREMVMLREERTNWLSKWSTLKIYMQVTLYAQQVIFRNVYACNAITISEKRKRRHEFEWKHGRLWDSLEGGKKKGKTVITL